MHIIDCQRIIVLVDNAEIIICATCMQINKIKLGYASSLLKIV